MITGQLLIGLGFALVYRQIRKTMAAVKGLQKLPVMIFEVGRAIGTQTLALSQLTHDVDNNMDVILEKLSTLQRHMDRFDRFGDQNWQTGWLSLLGQDYSP